MPPKRVFEIATQFNAIFRATPGRSTAASSASLLSMWTTRRIHVFLSILTAAVNRMEDASALRDAMEASVFFATSMGRLGGDFTALLPTIFEPKMTSLIVDQWKEGVSTLQETLKVCRDAGVATPLTSQTATATTTQTSLDQPPRQLLTVPPLARLVNSYLEGLNELRRCLLPGIFGRLRSELSRTLLAVRSVLETNKRAVLTPGLRGQAAQLREAATGMLTLFEELVEPYLRGALEVALGDFSAAKEHLQKTVVEEEEEEVEEEEEQGEEKEEGDEPEKDDEEENEMGEGAEDGKAEEVDETVTDGATKQD